MLAQLMIKNVEDVVLQDLVQLDEAESLIISHRRLVSLYEARFDEFDKFTLWLAVATDLGEGK